MCGASLAATTDSGCTYIYWHGKLRLAQLMRAPDRRCASTSFPSRLASSVLACRPVPDEALQDELQIMMDILHARADWESVGDKWFRKTQQYTEVFDQDLDLDSYLVVGAPYAGALGMP